MNVPRIASLDSSLFALTPLTAEELAWFEPCLRSVRPGDGLRAFCLDGYIDLCHQAGQGAACEALAERLGRFPSLVFMPLDLGMLLTFSAGRWFDPEANLRDAVRRLHAEAVYGQMAGGVVGRPLVLSANGSFQRFIENMTMFPKFSVNFGSITSTRTGPRSITVHHDNFYSWLDIIMLGTYEGLARYFGLELESRVEIHSAWTMDHHLSW